MLTAVDGALAQGGPDRLRMKIWDRATAATIYDNMMGAEDGADPVTALGGGSIVIHRSPGRTTEEAGGGTETALSPVTDASPVTAFAFHPVAPNPCVQAARLAFDLPAPSRVSLYVLDVQGRRVATVVASDLGAGRYSFEWDGRRGDGPRRGLRGLRAPLRGPRPRRRGGHDRRAQAGSGPVVGSAIAADA